MCRTLQTLAPEFMRSGMSAPQQPLPRPTPPLAASAAAPAAAAAVQRPLQQSNEAFAGVHGTGFYIYISLVTPKLIALTSHWTEITKQELCGEAARMSELSELRSYDAVGWES
eukprot:1161480-Pelagomonas_calceolata.AAC.1